jgi:hypothetical protein
VNAPTTVSLSLVSHTNVGKTTLGRTLLARDIGEVRDEAHVTEAAESHPLIESPEGDRLLLWDTPGFGDSLRLARRLAQAGNPIGWFLSEVWDRWRDRAFWSSQRALRHVLDHSDVVLYLVNASEAPEDAGYLDAELQVLALIGKPTVALLNQLGTAEDDAAAAHVARWRTRLERTPNVRAVLALDAFTRCWVEEGALWAAVAPLLPATQQAGFERLREAWRARQLTVWNASMDELARRLVRAARDRESAASQGWREPLRSAGQTVARLFGLRDDAQAGGAEQRAMAALAERLDADVRASVGTLIRLHGLEGEAGRDVLERLARHYAQRAPIDEGRAALWGGLVTGALAGLKADIASGGLTLGGGLLAGGVLGALGAAGAARGVNRVRGLDAPQLRWDAAVLDALLANALLGYLAVAHHGRGRGAWVQAAPPAGWTRAVDAALESRRAELAALWPRLSDDAGEVPRRLRALVASACAEVLTQLYPQAEALPRAA